MAPNACADVRRRRPPPVPPGAVAAPEVVDPGPGPANLAEARAEAVRLQVALARITPLQREVLVLVHMEGLRYTEVAAVLEVPVATVCSRAAAGYRAPRRLLAAGGEGVPQ